MREISAVGCDPLPQFCVTLCEGRDLSLRAGAGGAVPRRNLGSRNVHGSRICCCAAACAVGILVGRADFSWKVEIHNQGAA